MTAKDILAITTGTTAAVCERTLDGCAATLESAITSAAGAVAVYLVSALIGWMRKKIAPPEK